MSRFNKKFLSPALMLTLLPAMFQFGPEGVSWFWSNAVMVPALLLPTAAVFWVLYFKPHRQAGSQ